MSCRGPRLSTNSDPETQRVGDVCDGPQRQVAITGQHLSNESLCLAEPFGEFRLGNPFIFHGGAKKFGDIKNQILLPKQSPILGGRGLEKFDVSWGRFRSFKPHPIFRICHWRQVPLRRA